MLFYFLFISKTISFKIKSWFPWARCSADTDSYSSEIKKLRYSSDWNYSDFNLFLPPEIINASEKIGPILTPVWKRNSIPPDYPKHSILQLHYWYRENIQHYFCCFYIHIFSGEWETFKNKHPRFSVNTKERISETKLILTYLHVATQSQRADDSL